MINNKKFIAGYSLVELSISISIVALLVSGGLKLFSVKNESEKFDITIKRISKINDAIYNFIDVNGYIPCPARGTSIEYTSSDGYFGDSTVNTTNYNSSTQTCTGDSLTNETGMAPVRTLNLPDEYAYDGWGRKFTYRIANGMGSGSDFSDTSNRGDISVVDLSGFEKTDINRPSPNNYGAAYVLISHGPNGYGAYLKNNSGTFAAVPVNSQEVENTNHATNKVYIQNDRSQLFDDIVYFKKKSDFIRMTTGRSSIKIPSRTCANANTIINGGVPAISSSSLATQIYNSAQDIKLLCDNPPLTSSHSASSCSFRPTSVQPANLKLWLDANDPLYPSSAPSTGSSVSTWYDKSGNAANAVAVSAGTYTTTNPFGSIAGAKGAILFDGSSNYYHISGLSNPTTTFSIFVVEARNVSSTSSYYMFGRTDASTTKNTGIYMGYYYTGSSSLPYLYYAGATLNDMALPAEDYVTPAPNIFFYTFDPYNGRVSVITSSGKRYNQARRDDTTYATPAFSTSVTYAVGRALGGNYYSGYIGEIIYYDSLLSDSEISQIENYLVRKWISGECSS